LIRHQASLGFRFSPAILRDVFHVPEHSHAPVIGDDLQHNLCWQLAILALLGLPGYYVSVCFMDRAGRKNIQIQGFAMMALFLGRSCFQKNATETTTIDTYRTPKINAFEILNLALEYGNQAMDLIVFFL